MCKSILSVHSADIVTTKKKDFWYFEQSRILITTISFFYSQYEQNFHQNSTQIHIVSLGVADFSSWLLFQIGIFKYCFTFRHGFGLISKEALNCLLCAAVSIVLGLFGPLRPSLCLPVVPSTTKSSVTPDKKMFENKHYVLVSEIVFFFSCANFLGCWYQHNKKIRSGNDDQKDFHPHFYPKYHLSYVCH